ncbi:hypothetical protein WOLCODRAFT_21604 [Wolfiporia cocos MD-104 SS10]|uniref:DDE-1 domain-containing protein n=1 Tax=Wolfiporia cocos (strain MD-104) TaxID=742152 RepID=A0A2H3K4L5_WOLCO|nr:hypothetical protein WOLCODRAFT_21604 [Wolfiporia cocos MD-104 SS10]
MLWLDNFSRHKIAYNPTNIEIFFFDPDLTPFVQLLDAGVIHCFKVHYRKSFCQRAIELDEVGEDDIYKINQLEVMQLTHAAWDAITLKTIKNCWQHAFQLLIDSVTSNVIPQTVSTPILAPLQHHDAWTIMKAYASGKISTVPEPEDRLKAILGSTYLLADWKAVFDAIFAAEDDTAAAVTEIAALEADALESGSATNVECNTPILPQLQQLKSKLTASVSELQSWKQICGTWPTLDDLLNPAEESMIDESLYDFLGGDEEIVAVVRCEMETCNRDGPSNSSAGNEQSASKDEEEPEAAGELVISM